MLLSIISEGYSASLNNWSATSTMNRSQRYTKLSTEKNHLPLSWVTESFTDLDFREKLQVFNYIDMLRVALFSC